MITALFVLFCIGLYCAIATGCYVYGDRHDYLDSSYDSVALGFASVFWPFGMWAIAACAIIEALETRDKRIRKEKEEAEARKRKEDEMLKNEGFPTGGATP